MKLSEWKAILVVVLVAAVILSGVQIVRYIYFDKALLGEESYYHLRVSKGILAKEEISKDELVYGGRDYMFNPYDYVLAYFSLVAGVELALRVMPIILGIFSVILLYLLLKKAGLNPLVRLISCCILILSPSFIYGFSVNSKNSVFVFLFLSALYFHTRTDRFKYISVALLSIVPFFGLFETVLSIVSLFAFYLLYEKRGLILSSIAVIAVVALAYYVYFSYNFAPPERIDFIKRDFFRDFFSDLGAKEGHSIFAIFLAVIGIIKYWKKKLRLVLIYLILLFLIIGFYNLNQANNIYLSFMLSAFSGISFYELIQRNWQVKLLKFLTITVIICGLVFSAVSYLNVFIRSEPSKDVIDALQFLKNEDKGVVLSHYIDGFFIEAIAGKTVILDQFLPSIKNPNQRYVDSNFIFLTRSLKETKKMLSSYSIDYIFIDQRMKSGMVWEKEEQGLLFLFRNNETFKNIYKNDNAEIWKVNYETNTDSNAKGELG